MPVPSASWAGCLIWLLVLMIAAFLVSWLVADRLRANQMTYVGVLTLMTAGFTGSYVAWADLSIREFLIDNWLWGLAVGVLAGAIPAYAMARMKATVPTEHGVRRAARVWRSALTLAAAAAAAVADPASSWDAAIAAPVAADHYRLAVLAEGIGDNPDALTRFVLVSRPGVPAPRSGRDKTSLVAFMRDDHPGALLEILEQLTMRGVNMTRIESRPTGAALGNYCFSIDCEGHVDDARVGEALMGLRHLARSRPPRPGTCPTE